MISKKNGSELIPIDFIEQRIFMVRGRKVMLDADLAELYQILVKHLNFSVRRNKNRFPEDFAFQLTKEEVKILRSQFVTSSYGGRRYLPYVFTEQGVAMLSSVLRSDRAALVNVAIMRTFVRLRQLLAANKEFAEKLAIMESRYDKQFKIVFDVLKQLMEPPLTKNSEEQFGFKPK